MAPSIEQKLNVVSNIPNYPGREAGERVVRKLVQPWAQRKSVAIVQRLLGYWLMWSQVEGGRAEIVDRGWMGRRSAYQTEADFRFVFGVEVHEFDPMQLRYFFGLEDRETAEKRISGKD